MIKLNIKEISSFINGKLIGNKNLIVNSISINSKKINTNKCIFLAYKGKNFNSHEFVYESINNGAVAIIVEKFFYVPKYISQIIVNDTNESLYKIGEFIRNKLVKSFFIAITGSCGKTTVKEILVNILKETNIEFTYTLLNNNTTLGAVLTLINSKLNDKYIIFEIGMDGLGQIFKSVKIIKPDIILINNVYISHFENLESIYNLSKAKGEIFYGLSNNGKIILNYFSNYWYEWKYYFCNINKIPIYFSLNYNTCSSFYADNILLYNFKSNFFFNTKTDRFNLELNIPGIHNIYNSISALSISYLLGINKKYIKIGLKNFKNLKGRLYPIYIDKNKIIIDDTYNSNIESIISSVKFLSSFNCYKVLVLGDMSQMGKSIKLFHNILSNKIKSFNINKIISIGEYSKIISNNLNNGIHIENKNLLIKKIVSLINKYKKIIFLFKASRKFELDKIIKLILNII